MAGERSFSPEEKHVFETLFNTHDFEKLKEIEKRPQDFWLERKEHLDGATISHEEFCAIYTEKAKNCLQERIAQARHQPWFHQDINTISSILESHLEKDDPLFKDMQLGLYSLACDYMLTPDDIELQAMQSFPLMTITIHAMIPALRPLSWQKIQDKKRWLTPPDGKFAIFDSLVMLGQNCYLCAAAEDFKRWAHFTAHFGQLRGSFNTLNHDNIHAEMQERIILELSKVGISGEAYFQQCYNPTNLTTNNLIGLCQQTLGCFCNFHEEPSNNEAFKPGDINSLLFPTAPGLLDEGFLNIVPYFAQIPPDYDWKTKPLPFVPLDSTAVHKTLLDWRDQYCSFGRTLL